MTEMTYGWNLEMQMRAARAGLDHRRDPGALPAPARRRSPRLPGNLRGSLKAGLRIVATFVRVALQPAPPPTPRAATRCGNPEA